MQRAAHHRSDYRTGPHHSWLRRKAYHLMKIFVAVRLLGELLANLRAVGRGVYQLDRVDIMPRARDAFADAAIYLDDETGDVWN